MSQVIRVFYSFRITNPVVFLEFGLTYSTDASTDDLVFHFWIEQFLIPALPENSVVVMDNAAFHKRADILELLEQQGHKILWLPAYSPDLNPIEQMWAWVKRKRKEWLIDSVDELFRVFFESCMDNKVV